jgi:tetratricopeptide (TPR) repeat protein
MAFPIFFFLLMLLPICNFFINVGAVYGERFDYHASLGFVVIIAWLAIRVTRKVSFSTRKTAITGVMGALILVCAFETIARNSDWKNDNTLFMHDVNVVPNSEFADCDAAVGYINLSMAPGNETRKVHMLDTAIMLCRRAINLDKSFPDPFINAGMAYYFLSNLDSSKYYFDTVQFGLYPNHPKVRMFQPMLAKSYLLEARVVGANNPFIAIREIKKGISEDPSNAELWYNVGRAYYAVQRYDSARFAWTKAIQINPSDSIGKSARSELNTLNTVTGNASGK